MHDSFSLFTTRPNINPILQHDKHKAIQRFTLPFFLGIQIILIEIGELQELYMKTSKSNYKSPTISKRTLILSNNKSNELRFKNKY